MFKRGFWFFRLPLLLLTVLFISACNGTAIDSPESTDTAPAQAEIENIDPIDVGDALPPAHLAIPLIGVDTEVTPMGWRIAQVDGESSTVWDVPYTTAGWHVTSAGAGADENVVISGHQVVGEGVFASIALGELEAGMEIHLTDEAGQTFVYEVSVVSEPIPLVGATEDESDLAQSFVEPSGEAQLTLITGWPDFSTTHYLFAVADFVGKNMSDQ